jgi:hypothetical protein
MREIKFKVWNEEHNSMHGPFSIYAIADTDWPFIGKRVLYLQGTGIKDTHGNEIYEGDVISYREEDNAILTGEVRMRDAAFCVMGMILEKREFKLVYLHDIKVPVRIIGNGYEGMSSFRGGDNE